MPDRPPTQLELALGHALPESARYELPKPTPLGQLPEYRDSRDEPLFVNPQIRKFSCKPRCCEWCNKRHLNARPLLRTLVTTDIGFEMRLWVHAECAQEIENATPSKVEVFHG